MIEWIIKNKEWLFSGLLVGIPIALVGWFFSRRPSRQSQIQKAGDNSTNVQVGGNIEVKKGKKKNESDSKGRG